MHISITNFRTVSDVLAAWEKRLIKAGFTEQEIIVQDHADGKTVLIHLWYQDPHTTLTLDFARPQEHLSGGEKAELSYSYRDKEGISNIVCVSYDHQDGRRLNLIDCEETSTLAADLRRG